MVGRYWTAEQINAALAYLAEDREHPNRTESYLMAIRLDVMKLAGRVWGNEPDIAINQMRLTWQKQEGEGEHKTPEEMEADRKQMEIWDAQIKTALWKHALGAKTPEPVR